MTVASTYFFTTNNLFFLMKIFGRLGSAGLFFWTMLVGDHISSFPVFTYLLLLIPFYPFISSSCHFFTSSSLPFNRGFSLYPNLLGAFYAARLLLQSHILPPRLETAGVCPHTQLAMLDMINKDLLSSWLHNQKIAMVDIFFPDKVSPTDWCSVVPEPALGSGLSVWTEKKR